ncbi:MAG: transcription elongation factor GreAB [Trichlorobacter sp.]|uniref:transcription elongation factor GreAB n=1 Tax=Trichlorobacter sp. TaxID=2911007 RepID=UPI00255D95A2|nr:transcription elongation factor GreAB [Trichlorobacter sp.]MDK9716854.1 transcription elongation factor GreAB [Trichlorobacter sp.]
MTKTELLAIIISTLEADLKLFFTAAKAAHEAATHEECAPDNKYDTTALEASYIAQGQANRAQEIRVALEAYRNLVLQNFDDESPIRLSALVILEDEEGNQRRLFLGPYGGGMKIPAAAGEIVVITPGSPLGRSLLGKQVGDELQTEDHALTTAFTVVQVV